MTWLRIKKRSTRELLRSEPNPPNSRKIRFYMVIAILATALLSAYATYYALSTPPDLRPAALMAANQKLQDILAQNALKAQQDQATREELQLQVNQLSAEMKKLRSELAFFQQRKSPK